MNRPETALLGVWQNVWVKESGRRKRKNCRLIFAFDKSFANLVHEDIGPGDELPRIAQSEYDLDVSSEPYGITIPRFPMTGVFSFDEKGDLLIGSNYLFKRPSGFEDSTETSSYRRIADCPEEGFDESTLRTIFRDRFDADKHTTTEESKQAPPESMLEDVLQRVSVSAKQVELPKRTEEYLRNQRVPPDIISDFQKSSYDEAVEIGCITLCPLGKLDEFNEDEDYRACIRHGLLVMAFGGNGDPIALIKAKKMIFVSHESLLGEDFDDFSECLCGTAFSYEQFWEAALADEDFPGDYYECQEYSSSG